ncbi:hypothetical protein [Streptomyces sp. NPDC002540]
MAAHRPVSLATTASTPPLDLAAARPGTTVLHVPLRDLTVDAVLGAQNIVDDADHVCRERTSLHLAEQNTDGRDFTDKPIGALLCDPGALRRDPDRVLVCSLLGPGVLDLALATGGGSVPRSPAPGHGQTGSFPSPQPDPRP